MASANDRAEVLKRGTLYDVRDHPPFSALKRAGVTTGPWHGRVKARWTGEKRPPRAGEFYLSGAIIEAYKAYADLSTPYHIAELVSVGPPVTTHAVLEVLPLE